MKRMERVIGVQIISVSFGPVGRRLRKERAEALPLRELTPAMGGGEINSMWEGRGQSPHRQWWINRYTGRVHDERMGYRRESGIVMAWGTGIPAPS